MARFALRHWTAILIILVVGWWALFYLPATPSFAVIQLKRAIDHRDGAAAASFVDFPSVVKEAGYEMVQQRAGSGDVIGQMVGRGAVDILSKPMAAVVQAWAQRQVDQGAKQVQMPAWAVVAAIATLDRNDGTARMRFKDNRGRIWDIRLKRENDGRWRIVEVRDIQQLLKRLQKRTPGANPAPSPSPELPPNPPPSP